jgi:hypothetical protein
MSRSTTGTWAAWAAPVEDPRLERRGVPGYGNLDPYGTCRSMAIGCGSGASDLRLPAPMPVDVSVRRENGDPVLGVPGHPGSAAAAPPEPYYVDLVAGRSRQDYALLRVIDPYGDTCFNGKQHNSPKSWTAWKNRGSPRRNCAGTSPAGARSRPAWPPASLPVVHWRLACRAAGAPTSQSVGPGALSGRIDRRPAGGAPPRP